MIMSLSSSDSLLSYKTIPVGSLLTIPEEQESFYLGAIKMLPQQLKTLVTSERTGSYIRGVAKILDVSLEKTPPIAFMVLRVVIGEITLAQLGTVLATELQLPTDMAQAMAKDIEKELFGPVMIELNQYLRSKQDGLAEAPMEPPERTVSGPNVLDLRGGRPPQQ